jgi:hypothetical protein
MGREGKCIAEALDLFSQVSIMLRSVRLAALYDISQSDAWLSIRALSQQAATPEAKTQAQTRMKATLRHKSKKKLKA